MLLSIAVLYFLGIQSVASNNCPRLRCISRQLTFRDRLSRNVLLRCKLSSEPLFRRDAAFSRTAAAAAIAAPGSGWRTVAAEGAPGGGGDGGGSSGDGDETSSVSIIDGLCVTEYYLSSHLPNNSDLAERSSSSSFSSSSSSSLSSDPSSPPFADSESRVHLSLERVTGLGASRGRDWPMVCNTTSSPLFSTSSFASSSSPPPWQECAKRLPRLEIVERLSADRSVVCIVCSSISQTGEPELVYHSISRTLLLRVVLGSSSSSNSDSSSFVSSLSVTLNLFFRGPTSTGERSREPAVPAAPSPKDRPRSDGLEHKLSTTAKRCRWKCGWLPQCLQSLSLLCDGHKHCWNGVDETWCLHRSSRNKASGASGSYWEQPHELSLPLVYTLVTVGCVLGFVFLLLCFFWAFCTRSGSYSFRRSSSSIRRRRQRQSRVARGAEAAPALPGGGSCSRQHLGADPEADCPLCGACCSGAFSRSYLLGPEVGGSATRHSLSSGCGNGAAVLVEQPSTACSSSGVFEESNASSSIATTCPNCCSCRRSRQLLPQTELGLSDSSSAISGCGPSGELDGAALRAMLCNQNGGSHTSVCSQRPTNRALHPTGWPPITPLGRSCGPSSEALSCQGGSSGSSRHHQLHSHHHRPSRTRRHARPVDTYGAGQLFSSAVPAPTPSHHQDWLLNLPASVRRCNDDDPRPILQTTTSSAPPTSTVVSLSSGSGGGSVGANVYASASSSAPTAAVAPESGRLLPPPNLNPFLDVPHHFRRTVTATVVGCDDAEDAT